MGRPKDKPPTIVLSPPAPGVPLEFEAFFKVKLVEDNGEYSLSIEPVGVESEIDEEVDE